jgi:Arc/MetJ-type ribon-helix-helix transcriptional regulator
MPLRFVWPSCEIRLALMGSRGRYADSAALLRRALRLITSQVTAQTSEHLALWNDLGMVYKYLGKFQTAEEFYRLALHHSTERLKRPRTQ